MPEIPTTDESTVFAPYQRTGPTRPDISLRFYANRSNNADTVKTETAVETRTAPEARAT
jgi:hypothetical protein